MTRNDLDCVIVGYHDVPVDEEIRRVAEYQEFAGTYRHLLANTVVLNGTRVKYFPLLNYAIEAATGRQTNYNVAHVPNLGAFYLASFLKKRGLTADVINYFSDERPLFAELLAKAPNVVAITTTYYLDQEPIREIVDFVRSHSPATKVVIGGPHIFNICSDLRPGGQEFAFAEMGGDIYVFDSQGELTLWRICRELRMPRPSLDAIPNLIYTSDHKHFSRTAREVESNDMDENTTEWGYFASERIAPIAQIRTARSCAFKCAFCRYPVVAGALNLTSTHVVERELRTLAERGVTHLLIVDDTFNIPEKRFKEVCRMIIANNFRFEWFSYFRCANADDESFDLLAAAGCKGVFLGIESADLSVLRAMNKGASPEKYAAGVTKLNERGIMTYASFIVGFPGETEETARRTIDFIREYRPTAYSLETFYYDKKVPIHERGADFGLTGSAYAWRHNTMDWRRASEIVEEGYRSIAESAVLPLHGFDIWSLGYLTAHGFTREQLFAFLRVASKSMVGSLTGGTVDAAEYRDELASVFRSWRPPTPPRNDRLPVGPAAPLTLPADVPQSMDLEGKRLLPMIR
jgi:radical SAM PhpK family P-methyltransferase